MPAPVPALKTSAPLPAAIISTSAWNQRVQEMVRAGITGSLILLFVGVVAYSCYESHSWKDHWNQTKEMLQIILPAITGILGSSLGFYFGKGSQPVAASSADNGGGS